MRIQTLIASGLTTAAKTKTWLSYNSSQTAWVRVYKVLYARVCRCHNHFSNVELSTNDMYIFYHMTSLFISG